MKHLIEQIRIGDPKKWENKQKNTSGEYYPVGIKIKGQWYNQNVFDVDFLNELKESLNKEIELILYKEEWQGREYDKFKKPTKLELVMAENERLKKNIKWCVDKIKSMENSIQVLNERTQGMA